jgi:hypothetical protein
MPIYEYKCECSPDSIVPKERSINSIEPNYLCNECVKDYKDITAHLVYSLKVTGFIKQIILSSLN